MEKKKLKRKLSKAEIIVKSILFGISAILLVCGVVFNCVKRPIEGSIYTTNTTYAEREKIWEDEFDRLYDVYDKMYSLDYFKPYMEPVSHAVGQILYKSSISSNRLTFELYNNSVNTATIYSVMLRNKEDSSLYYNISVQMDVRSLQTLVNYLDVTDGFDINDYYIYCSYKYNEHLWSQSPISSYQSELERTKSFTIGRMIRDEIGEKPDNIKENMEDDRPEYMDAINENIATYVMLYIFAGLTFIVACVVGLQKVQPTRTYGASASPVEVIIKEVKVQDDHNEEECKHHNKVKKVVCLYCGSRYKDSLDKCPDCGSSRIKEEPKPEGEEPAKNKKSK